MSEFFPSFPSDMQLARVIETMSDGLTVYDVQGRATLANAAAARILGVPRERIIGAHYAAVPWGRRTLDGKPFPMERHPFNVLRETGADAHEVEFLIVRPDGSEAVISLRAVPQRDAEARFAGIIAAFTDVTEHRRAVRALRDSEERFRAAFEYASIGFVLVDERGVLLRVNPAWCDFIGYTAEECTGHHFREFMHPDDVPESEENLRALLAGSRPVLAREKRYRHRDGALRWGLVSTSLARDLDGGFVCFITNIQDVTQRRQIEAERDRLREEQARIRSALETDRLKTELLNTVSHELRTPLAAIKGYATALLLFPDDVDQAERTAFLQEIEDAADRLSELVENLLQVGRGDVSVLDLRLERHDLGPLVAQAVVDARRRFPERTIELHDDGAAQPILADPHRIRQVLFNLIDNAIKFSPSTAAITISRSATADGRSHVIVQDRGIGIPPEHHERIFEPFYRVGEGPGHAAGGTGLGLAICRRIIEAHGGTIKVESVPGAGSAFIATLPAAARIEDTIAAP